MDGYGPFSESSQRGHENLVQAFRQFLFQTRSTPIIQLERTQQIVHDLSTYARHLQIGNFVQISEADLTRLYNLYNVYFFSGMLQTLVRSETGKSLSLRLSNRMTRAAGKTFRSERRSHGKSLIEYQIAVSTLLLFQTFRDSDRPITVCGLPCNHRRDALFRIFEHELIHLVEFLVWGNSSCSAKRFQELACRFFGHVGVHHDLITPQEHAKIHYDVKVGDRVQFTHEGEVHVGLVNRITRRATVLVETPRGREFTNGRRYMTFYVPLAQLQSLTTRES